jgi:hypothetical protein
LKARIHHVPTDRISRIDPKDLYEDIPGKLWRRIWRMSYLDCWLFAQPWQEGHPVAAHAHEADEVIFNYRSVSVITDDHGGQFVVNEGDAFFFPSGVAHGGRVGGQKVDALFLSIFCPHRPASPNLAWSTYNPELEKARAMAKPAPG